MKGHFSYKHYNKGSFGSFLRRTWRIVERIFPQKDTIHYKRGRVQRRRLSTSFQLFSTLAVLLFVGWSSYTSYLYISYSELLTESDQKVTYAKEQYKRMIEQVDAYKDNVARIANEIDNHTSMMARKLTQKQEITEKERDKLVKKQQMLTAEMDYVNKKIRQFSVKQDFTKINKDSLYYKLQNLELQRDIAWRERRRVNTRNEQLETVLIEMKDAQTLIMDKVEVLASEKLKELYKDFEPIDYTLSNLGLKNKKRLVKSLEHSDTVAIGGPFEPIEETKISDNEIQKRFDEVKDKIYLWEGLSSVKQMLPLGSPVTKPRVTSFYGTRRDPLTGQTANHRGLDFGGPIGTPLLAVSPGRVVRAGTRGAYGNAVEIDHGLGFTTLYAHLNKIIVKKGDYVREQQIIGLAGNTGRSTGPHLHYEVRYNGRQINPYNFYQMYQTKK